MDYLPINLTLLNAHIQDCWAYYCYLYQTTTDTYCSFTPTTKNIILTLNAKRSILGRVYADLSPQIWSTYKRNWEKDKLIILDEPTTMMRPQVFDRLHEVIMKLPRRSRNSYCRLYLYMYFKCHYCGGEYGISITRLGVELAANTRTICREISHMIDSGLLCRMGKYNADLGMSYRYYIPLQL